MFVFNFSCVCGNMWLCGACMTSCDFVWQYVAVLGCWYCFDCGYCDRCDGCSNYGCGLCVFLNEFFAWVVCLQYHQQCFQQMHRRSDIATRGQGRGGRNEGGQWAHSRMYKGLCQHGVLALPACSAPAAPPVGRGPLLGHALAHKRPRAAAHTCGGRRRKPRQHRLATLAATPPQRMGWRPSRLHCRCHDPRCHGCWAPYAAPAAVRPAAPARRVGQPARKPGYVPHAVCCSLHGG